MGFISFYPSIVSNGLKTFVHLLLSAACVILSASFTVGQSLPEVPFDIEFAGVSVHLTQPSRLQVQQEVRSMYANRGQIQAEMSTLQQLTTLIKPLFKEADIPDDFRYAALPFTDIDSLGFWGITSAQAKDLKLRIDNTVDERYHPVLSTEAVLANLARLQKTQGNYVLSLIQYLKGERRPAAPSRIDPTYLLVSPQSPPLLWKILARKLVFDYEQPTYHPTNTYVLFEYQDGEGKTLRTIAERLRVPVERIDPLNRWLKTAAIPTDKEYSVLIQVTPDEFSAVRAVAESGRGRQVDVGFPILVKQDEQGEGLRSLAIFYTINDRRGVQAQNCDNFITLAFYGNVTVNAFLKYNDLGVKDVARPGEIYYLERKAKRAKVPYHVVQKNQTLREVSNMYGVRLSSLLKFNHLTPTQRIQIGRVLWLQNKRPADRPAEYRQLPVDEQYINHPDDPVVVEKPAPTPRSVDTVQNITRQNESVAQSNVKPSVANPPVTSDTAAQILDEDLTAIDDSLAKVEVPLEEMPGTIKLHVVTAGQTYFTVARLYGVKVSQLCAWNNLSLRTPLKAGQELIVDVSEKERPKAVKPVAKKQPKRDNLVNLYVVSPERAIPVRPLKPDTYHIVQPGQTLYRVSVINKVSVDDLKRWNNLVSNIIEVGQKLLIRK